VGRLLLQIIGEVVAPPEAGHARLQADHEILPGLVRRAETQAAGYLSSPFRPAMMSSGIRSG
jgi:hypothetical protein